MREIDIWNLLFSVVIFGLAIYYAQPKRSEDKRRQAAPRSKRQNLMRRRLIRRRAVWIGSTIAGVLALLASIYQLLGGPPWPTDPVFSAEAPSSASPFDNPFDVANSSGLVDIRDLSIHCEITRLNTKRMRMTVGFGGTLLFLSRGPNPLLPAGTKSAFTCPFREAMDAIKFGADALDDPTSAQIWLIGAYDTPGWWHGFWFNPHRETRATFTLDVKTIPPRWMPGLPLR
jgi:hypothetical protein